MSTLTVDRTALSYWFPLIEAAGLPVPRTRIVHMQPDAWSEIWQLLDGKQGNASAFFAKIEAAGGEIGFPCFLRTDHTSNKHRWEESSYLKCAADIPQHVVSIAEFSECVDMFGLPWSTWAVRELLPTNPFGVCPRYGNMPVVREFRFFVDDGSVRCGHPYWPKDALAQGGAPRALDYYGLCLMGHAEPELAALAGAAGRAVGGAWSVDILETQRGWYVTDMAEATRSWHWPECPDAEG